MKTTRIFTAALGMASLAVMISPTRGHAANDAELDDNAAAANLVGAPAAIDHFVYLSQLPSPDSLVQAAAAKGVKIVRMDRTKDRIVVVYQYAGGATQTYAYVPLPGAGASGTTAIPMPAPSPAPAVTAAPATAPSTVIYTAPATSSVVYTSPPPVTYYDYWPYYTRAYDPAWDFWAPFSVGVGVGWVWRGGGYHYGRGNWGHGGHWSGGRGHHR